MKGATLYHKNNGVRGILISIHAPMKGATEGNYLHEFVDSISIHAPMKGATYDSATYKTRLKRFQSTRP